MFQEDSMIQIWLFPKSHSYFQYVMYADFLQGQNQMTSFITDYFLGCNVCNISKDLYNILK